MKELREQRIRLRKWLSEFRTVHNQTAANNLTFATLQHRLLEPGGNFSDRSVVRAAGTGHCRRMYISGNCDHYDNT
jgi:hypothetical protein